jgi:hypothetical protein
MAAATKQSYTSNYDQNAPGVVMLTVYSAYVNHTHADIKEENIKKMNRAGLAKLIQDLERDIMIFKTHLPDENVCWHNHEFFASRQMKIDQDLLEAANQALKNQKRCC